MANQWLLLYFLLIFGIGIFSLGIASVAYLRVRNALLESYLYFYVAFSVSLAIETVLSYLFANFPNTDPDGLLLVGLSYLDTVTIYLLLLTLPVFAHELFACERRKIRNVAASALAIGGYLFYHLRLAIFIIWGKRFSFMSLLLDLHVIAVVFYCAFLSVQHYKASTTQSHRKKSGAICFLFLCTSIIIIEDELLDTIPFPVYPLAYAGFGLVFGAYFFSLYWPKHQAAVEPPVEKSLEPIALSNREPVVESQQSDQSNSFNEFCQQFELSSREADVLLLLLKGQTNNQIAERLFISINTVKTHISNIYQKIGVSRRYELLARCKDFSFRS